MVLRRPALVVLISFFAVAMFSVVMYLARPSILERRVLFFPEITSFLNSAESRFLPRSGSQEQLMRELLQAVLAGPQDVTLGRIFPKDAQLRQVYAKDGAYWFNFNLSALAPDERCPLNGKERFVWLHRTVKHNFPLIGKVVYLVDGREVAVF